MSNATVPLQPWQVSSVGIDGGPTPVNFADLTNCSTKPSSVTKDLFGDEYDACHPSLQYDISYLSTIQPEWATCVDVGGIVFDPPSALTSASALNGPDPQATVPKAASPSLTHSATPGAHPPQAPPMTDPTIGPSMPKQTQVDPAGRASPTKTLQETPSDPTTQSSADLPDVIDPSTKLEDAAAAGQVSNGPAGDHEDANTDDPTSPSQASTVVVANISGTPTMSSPDASQAHGSGEDPTGGPSDSGNNPSPPRRPLIVGDQKTTVPTPGVTALEKADSQTLDAQTPVSNTPISLTSSGKPQTGISVHSSIKPTPAAAAGTVFTIGPQTFTLNPQGVTGDGIQIPVGGTPVTVHGTRFSLGPSEFIVGDRTETFAPAATRGPLVGVKGGGVVGQGVAAGSERNVTTSADAGVGGSALMSGLGAVGGGGATTSQGAGQGSRGNVSGSAAPFLGTASKPRGVGVGSSLFVFVVCLVIVTD